MYSFCNAEFDVTKSETANVKVCIYYNTSIYIARKFGFTAQPVFPSLLQHKVLIDSSVNYISWHKGLGLSNKHSMHAVGSTWTHACAFVSYYTPTRTQPRGYVYATARVERWRSSFLWRCWRYCSRALFAAGRTRYADWTPSTSRVTIPGKTSPAWTAPTPSPSLWVSCHVSRYMHPSVAT